MANKRIFMLYKKINASKLVHNVLTFTPHRWRACPTLGITAVVQDANLLEVGMVTVVF